MRYVDYYQILGVARDAPVADIKKAFRKLARQYHPDISKEKDAEKRMKEVNEAYTVLADPEKRAAYDQLGQAPQGDSDFRPPPNWDAGFEFSGGNGAGYASTDFSDFFAQIFGQMGRGKTSGYSAPRAQGDDHHAKILIDLEDAFHAAVHEVSLRVPTLDASGHMQLQQRRLKVKIPLGIREGQFIRLAGQGAAGSGDAPAGDLILEVHFKPHPRFRVEGRDLFMTLPIAPWEAVLGAHFNVTLPSGELKLKLPVDSPLAKPLRVRGKGLPGDPPGDLWLQLQMVLPPSTTKARELWQTMAKELAFDPREGASS